MAVFDLAPRSLNLAPSSAGSAGETGLIGWILGLMERLGEIGVGIAVLAETFLPPIPSEAVLPAAGYLAFEGRMNPYWAIAAATVGSLLGAWGWWAAGAAMGRERTLALVERLPLLDREDFERAETFFTRWGPAAVLVGRCVPLVRSFISIPAGIARMPFWSFSLYTLIGSVIWNSLWIGLGFGLGPAMEPVLTQWSGTLSTIVVVTVAALAALWVARRLRSRSRASQSVR